MPLNICIVVLQLITTDNISFNKENDYDENCFSNICLKVISGH